jgi:hypothetical protein
MVAYQQNTLKLFISIPSLANLQDKYQQNTLKLFFYTKPSKFT